MVSPQQQSLVLPSSCGLRKEKINANSHILHCYCLLPLPNNNKGNNDEHQFYGFFFAILHTCLKYLTSTRKFSKDLQYLLRYKPFIRNDDCDFILTSLNINFLAQEFMSSFSPSTQIWQAEIYRCITLDMQESTCSTKGKCCFENLH